MLAAPFFKQLDLITLTDPEDEVRWISLGVKPELLKLTGNIKHDAPARESEKNVGDPVLLAASTHAGEEQEVAAAWLSLSKDFPNLRLVLTPRHAERRGDVLTAVRKLGIDARLRSEGAGLSEAPLVLDTTGELSGWYGRATVAFVGKSLPCAVNHGGQNMIEPLQTGTPVVIGPCTGNFEPLASRLCEAGAALRVKDRHEIATAVKSLLDDPGKREAMVSAAYTVLKPHQGATERNCDLIEGLMGRSPLHPS